MADFQLQHQATSNSVPIKRTCRICNNQFIENHEKACIYHPESYSGETAQRWLPPGECKGGNIIHKFYSCCGARDINSKGCCYSRHITYDENAPISLKKPGMGVNSNN